MLDLGWTEILVIGVVALIVVGPKDLPRMLRTLGQYTGKLRGMAREFQRSMDDAAREADLAEFKDIKKSLDDVRAIQSDTARAVNQSLTNADRAIDKSLEDEAAAKPTRSTAPAEAPAEPSELPEAAAAETPPKSATGGP